MEASKIQDREELYLSAKIISKERREYKNRNGQMVINFSLWVTLVDGVGRPQNYPVEVDNKTYDSVIRGEIFKSPVSARVFGSSVSFKAIQ